MEAIQGRVRLSEADYRCIRFAKTCQRFGFNPRDFAGLCAATRAAFNAGVRECNLPDYSAEKARAKVERIAEGLGLSVDWSGGLFPSFWRSDESVDVATGEN